MPPVKPKRVLIDQSTLDFYIAESAAIHALCDRAEVPQAMDDTTFSMSQRVAILSGVAEGLMKKAGRPSTPLH